MCSPSHLSFTLSASPFFFPLHLKFVGLGCGRVESAFLRQTLMSAFLRQTLMSTWSVFLAGVEIGQAGPLGGGHWRGWGGLWLRFCGGFISGWVWFDFGSWFGFGILGLDLVGVGLDLIYSAKEDIKPRHGRRWRRGGKWCPCPVGFGSAWWVCWWVY